MSLPFVWSPEIVLNARIRAFITGGGGEGGSKKIMVSVKMMERLSLNARMCAFITGGAGGGRI